MFGSSEKLTLHSHPSIGKGLPGRRRMLMPDEADRLCSYPPGKRYRRAICVAGVGAIFRESVI